MATAHLLFGYIGVGKTTAAKRLEHEHSAVRFTPDEWMARLFSEDPPAAMFQEKAAAVLELLEPMWTRCLSLGVDVVLDYGFWSRNDRDRVRELTQSLGARSVLYNVACDEAEARARIATRNQAGHRSLYIAPATYDLLKARFEPLASDEARVDV